MLQPTLGAPGVLAALAIGLTLGGCSGGAAIGEACRHHSDCAGDTQCVQRVCAPLCARAPECGDGYSCDESGLCVPARATLGGACTSEVDCTAGLSCHLDFDDAMRPIKQCAPQRGSTPAGGACATDADCRNGTCALGRCVDLCSSTRDCEASTSCVKIPYANAPGAQFLGCLPERGVVTWSPPRAPRLTLPVPENARQLSLVISTALPRAAAAVRVAVPAMQPLFQLCRQDGDFSCSAAEQRAQYYVNPTRHRPEPGQAVLAIPSTSADALQTGALYTVDVRSLNPDGSAGPTPTVTAVVRLGAATRLDLHFHFLDLSEHPCVGAFSGGRLDAAAAAATSNVSFQETYLGELRSILRDRGGLTLGEITYEDVARPDLDELELPRAGELLALGRHSAGVNIFFVRSLSPAGVRAFGPAPGPAGLAGTAGSGIVVGADMLCYREWPQIARITAYQIARYLGLSRNVEPDHTPATDGERGNLLFYSDLGGDELTPGQRDILSRSPALR